MSTTCSSSLAHHKMEISGLSERFVAGMWRQFLLVELCWHIVIVSAGFQTHLRVGELPPASNNQPIYGSRCQSVFRMLFDEVDPDDCNPDNWDLLTDTVFPYGLLQYWVLRQQDRIRMRRARSGSQCSGCHSHLYIQRHKSCAMHRRHIPEAFSRLTRYIGAVWILLYS